MCMYIQCSLNNICVQMNSSTSIVCSSKISPFDFEACRKKNLISVFPTLIDFFPLKWIGLLLCKTNVCRVTLYTGTYGASRPWGVKFNDKGWVRLRMVWTNGRLAILFFLFFFGGDDEEGLSAARWLTSRGPQSLECEYRCHQFPSVLLSLQIYNANMLVEDSCQLY